MAVAQPIILADFVVSFLVVKLKRLRLRLRLRLSRRKTT